MTPSISASSSNDIVKCASVAERNGDEAKLINGGRQGTASQRKKTFDVGENVRRAYRLGAGALFADGERYLTSDAATVNDASLFLATMLKLKRQQIRRNNDLLTDYENEQKDVNEDKNRECEPIKTEGDFLILHIMDWLDITTNKNF